MKRGASLAWLVAAALASGAAQADPPPSEDRDLELIPQSAPTPSNPAPPAPAAPGGLRKIYLENAFTQSWTRTGLLVPPPPPPASPWEERVLLDVREEWRASGNLALFYSGRLNLRAEDGLDFPSHQNVTNNLREAYASWEPLERWFVDAGRINLKSGVALGFNPTDYFKTRAVVEPLSADPVVLREDRLGTLMLRAQRIWSGGSVTAAYAPKVASISPIYTDADLRSFDPMFDRTNAQDRLLVKGGFDIGDRFSVESLAYHDSLRTRWGSNLTASVSQGVVAYIEWSGGPGTGVSEEAVAFGRASGTLPAAAPDVLPQDAQTHFSNQLAAGASYAASVAKITLNLEYHLNQAAFSARDWDDWFRVGTAAGPGSRAAGELWYIRSYALDRQEPIGRNSLFLRGDWVDALVPKLELTGFVDSDLADASTRIQLSADYYASDHWTVGGQVLLQTGPRHSDFGSLPQGGSVLLKVARYF